PARAGLEFAGVVDRIQSSTGNVIAEPLDALAIAGKSVIVEPWAADALYQSGTWDIEPLVERVCDGDVTMAVLAHKLDDSVVAYQDYGIWPKPLLKAMRSRMLLLDEEAGRYVYVLRPEATCDGALIGPHSA